MKIICVEEHYLDKAFSKASMAVALAQAPFLLDWAKTVTDGNSPDRSRPQIEKNDLINLKGSDLGSGRLADMDQAGITMPVLSVGGFPHLAPAAEAVNLSHAANDRLARAVNAHPDRFAAFATLPWAQPDEAEKELERTVKELGFKGALLNGRLSSHFIDHPDFNRLLKCFNALGVLTPGFLCAAYSRRITAVSIVR